MNQALTFEELQKLTGYDEPGQVAACLARNEIKVFYGKFNRPFTTTDLMKEAGSEPMNDSNIDLTRPKITV